MARRKTELVTAFVHRNGMIEFSNGVGFPDATIPLCCGTRDAVTAALRTRAFDGRDYRVDGVTGQSSDQDWWEQVECLRVSICGISDDIISYFQGMGRRDSR